MSTRTLVIVGLAATALLGSAAATTWALWPEPVARDQRTAALEVASPAKRRAIDGNKARSDAGRRGPKAAGDKAGVKKARATKPKPEAMLAAEDRAKARSEFREERLMGVNERLDAYAEEAGWSEEVTEEIRNLLIDTSDDISGQLNQIDQGQRSWEETRRQMRQSRLDQAARVKELIGEDEFPAFVQGMEFGRFFGDEPVRGRLE